MQTVFLSVFSLLKCRMFSIINPAVWGNSFMFDLTLFQGAMFAFWNCWLWCWFWCFARQLAQPWQPRNLLWNRLWYEPPCTVGVEVVEHIQSYWGFKKKITEWSEDISGKQSLNNVLVFFDSLPFLFHSCFKCLVYKNRKHLSIENRVKVNLTGLFTVGETAAAARLCGIYCWRREQ